MACTCAYSQGTFLSKPSSQSEISLILPPPASLTAFAHFQPFKWVCLLWGSSVEQKPPPGPGPSPLAVSTAPSTSHHRGFPVRVLWMELQGQDLLCSNYFPKGWAGVWSDRGSQVRKSCGPRGESSLCGQRGDPRSDYTSLPSGHQRVGGFRPLSALRSTPPGFGDATRTFDHATFFLLQSFGNSTGPTASLHTTQPASCGSGLVVWGP